MWKNYHGKAFQSKIDSLANIKHCYVCCFFRNWNTVRVERVSNTFTTTKVSQPKMSNSISAGWPMVDIFVSFQLKRSPRATGQGSHHYVTCPATGIFESGSTGTCSDSFFESCSSVHISRTPASYGLFDEKSPVGGQKGWDREKANNRVIGNSLNHKRLRGKHIKREKWNSKNIFAIFSKKNN